MSNLFTKTTVATLAAVTLIGGTSAVAHAQSPMSLIAANAMPAPQAVFNKNDIALQNVRLNANDFQSRRSADLNNRGWRDLELGQTNFGQSRIGDAKFGQSEFNRSNFGQDRFGQSRLSNHDVESRMFAPSKRFSSHVNSDQNFKKATLLTSRF